VAGEQELARSGGEDGRGKVGFAKALRGRHGHHEGDATAGLGVPGAGEALRGQPLVFG
jgi:hypothetical protein